MGSLCGSGCGPGNCVWTWIWTCIWACTWIWTKKLEFPVGFLDVLIETLKKQCFFYFSLKSAHLAWSLRLKWSLYEEFLKVAFQKAVFCSARGRPVTEGKATHHIEFSHHMEVRTLNARRMFREKESWNSNGTIMQRKSSKRRTNRNLHRTQMEHDGTGSGEWTVIAQKYQAVFPRATILHSHPFAKIIKIHVQKSKNVILPESKKTT